MLVIRDEQTQSLSDAGRRNFEQRLADHLEASPGEVSTLVDAALAQGVTRECDVAQCVEHALSVAHPDRPAPAAGGPEFGKNPVGRTTAPCPSQQPLHWIEIELVGEDGGPIPGEAYRIKLPDGTVVNGTLDAQGAARVASIVEPGACQITFPALDREGWEPIGD